MSNDLEPTPWIGIQQNRLGLQCFRRGLVALEGAEELSIVRDEKGDFRLFKGKQEIKQCGFSSRDINHIVVRHHEAFPVIYIC